MALCGARSYAVAISTNMKDLSKTLLLLSLAVAGSGAWASKRTACGDDTVLYTVSTKPKAALPGPTAGHAEVVIIASVRDLCSNCTDITTRTAIDGAWIGANAGNSYFLAEVAPGNHEICADRQRPLIGRGAALGFKAEAGHTYYFLVHVAGNGENASVDGSSGERLTLLRIPEAKARHFIEDIELSVPVVYH